MGIRNGGSSAFSVGAAGSYLIRHFVASARSELATAAQLPWLRRPTTHSTFPRRSRASYSYSSRLYSTKPDAFELLDTPWPAIETPKETPAKPDASKTTSAPETAANNSSPSTSSTTEDRLSSPSPASEDHLSSPSASADANLPWYLRTPSPVAPPHPPPRQSLPSLPPSPPPLLSPLLTHLSTDLGIDDLSLLDLRSLDRPAALGANLLMLLGTARSDKHLHVAADRLCRWLRSAHGLKPFADGLLGRNELKLARRRRAKRANLLKGVGGGSTGGEGLEDGLRTGWVCVNLGREEGCRVVVQMMTDEKRGQLDLESLWMGLVKRSEAGKGDVE
ncbi:hypothetical protein K461DRAFT_96317 [Myriangium duriaei CBS 260.36]|uniref:ATPase synthesis protein 25 n=1 Tax=Myriangium duriaei CBS 260.36 TaxID=1168546 RepID=A0A9P4J6W6_9PEZI|nr:hypothetical protein K461DRAFT_96317 [Myriangium duriaei CBS 260.36]